MTFTNISKSKKNSKIKKLNNIKQCFFLISVIVIVIVSKNHVCKYVKLCDFVCILVINFTYILKKYVFIKTIWNSFFS